MKEEALMQGRGLLSKMTELKDVTSVTWKESGAGEDFRQLCILLKGNAIPARELSINGKFQFIVFSVGSLNNFFFFLIKR